MNLLSNIAQGFQGWIHNEMIAENPQDQDSESPMLAILVTFLAVAATIWCHRPKRPIALSRANLPVEKIAIQDRLKEVKRQFKQERTEPSQSIDALDGPSDDKEDNFLSCSKERTRILHTMSSLILSRSKVKSFELEIQNIAEKTIESFIENGDHQACVDLRFYMRRYVFTVFSTCFSGSMYRGYTQDVLANGENLLKYKIREFSDDTFIGYMYNRPQHFTDKQIRRTLISLLLGMHATTGHVLIATMNLWAKFPKQLQKIRSIANREEFRHELNKHVVESLRCEAPPGTMRQRGIVLTDFLDHPDLVGPYPYEFLPERFNHADRELAAWSIMVPKI